MKCMLDCQERTDFFPAFAAVSDDDKDGQAAVAAFGQVVAYCVTQSCRRAFVLGHFGEALPKQSCTGCDCCESSDTVKAQV